MARGTVRYTERTYLSHVLEADPDFYVDANNYTAFEFSNGRKFKARLPYDNYTVATPPAESDDVITYYGA